MAQVAYVDWDGLVYYDSKIKKHLTDKLENCLKDGGKKFFAELPDPSYDNLNYIYTVADDFTSTDIFAIAGLDYEAGTVVKVSEIQLNPDQPAVYRYTILNQRFSDVDADALNSINERITALEDAGFITSIPDDLIDESELRDTLTGYATLSDLQTAIDSIPAPDLSNYYTKEESDNKYLTEHQDLSGYAKVEDVDKKISDIKAATDLNSKDIEHILDDLNKAEESISTDHARVDTLISEVGDIKTSVALKPDRSDIPTAISQLANDSNYATESFVRDAILDAEVDLTGYATKDDLNTKADKATTLAGYGISDAYTKSQVDAKIAEIGSGGNIDLDGYVSEDEWTTRISNYYTKAEVDNLIPDNYLTEDALSGYAKITDLDNYAKSSDIPDAVSDLTNDAGYITAGDIPTNVSEFNNDAGYLTAHQDISGKLDVATYNEEKSTFALKTELPKDYLTQDDLAGYSKFSGSYNDLTDKPEIPSIEGFIKLEDVETAGYIKSDALAGYATETFVTDEINKLDIPDVSNLATKDEVSVKADSILFTTDKIVNNAVGSFVVGDNVNGMTLSEIISKLLNLSAPTGPDVPSGGVIGDIVNNKTPMYSINGDGNVVQVPYDAVLTYTVADNNTQPTQSGFYQIVGDNGEVIESGYQELSANNPDVPHIIALPKGVDFNTMVTTEVFNTKAQEWVPTTLNMSNNITDIEALCNELGVDISHIDQNAYTIWADLEYGPTGSIIRYIIKE